MCLAEQAGVRGSLTTIQREGAALAATGVATSAIGATQAIRPRGGRQFLNAVTTTMGNLMEMIERNRACQQLVLLRQCP